MTKRPRGQRSPEEAEWASKRSTTDPLQINFAEADMVEGVEHAGPVARAFAWIFMAVPPIIAWCGLVYVVVQGWDPCNRLGGDAGVNCFAEAAGIGERLFGIGLIAAGAVVACYWPYVLTRAKKRLHRRKR